MRLCKQKYSKSILINIESNDLFFNWAFLKNCFTLIVSKIYIHLLDILLYNFGFDNRIIDSFQEQKSWIINEVKSFWGDFGKEFQVQITVSYR